MFTFKNKLLYQKFSKINDYEASEDIKSKKKSYRQQARLCCDGLWLTQGRKSCCDCLTCSCDDCPPLCCSLPPFGCRPCLCYCP